MLVDGEWAALIGGYGADYDLMPDGIEMRKARWTCRGPELHAVIDGS